MADDENGETAGSGSGDEEDLFGGDDDEEEEQGKDAEEATAGTAPVENGSAPAPAPPAAAPEEASETPTATEPPPEAVVETEAALASAPAAAAAAATTVAAAAVAAAATTIAAAGATSVNVPPVSSPRTSIPRKGSAVAAADTLSPGAAIPSKPPRNMLSSIDPAKFGLPSGVIIPPSVKGDLLSGKLLDTLKTLPQQLINDALTEYDDAVQIKGEAIRNHGAYLYGVIKRYINVQERAARGEGNGVLPMGVDLTPAVQGRLQKLVADHFCTQDEMNEKVKSKIRMLSEKDALFAIDELASVERRQIRNFGSYFMGILNRYMRGDAGPGRNVSKMQNQGNNRQNNKFDDRKRSSRWGPGDNDFQQRGQNNNRQGFRDNKRQRGRENSFDQQDRRNKPYDGRYSDNNRGQSRFQDARSNPYGPQAGQQQQYSPPYGQQPPQQMQQQPPPYPGQQPPPPAFPGHQPPPDYSGQQAPPPYGGVPGNPPPPPPRTAPGGIPGMNHYQPQQNVMQNPPATQGGYPSAPQVDQSQFAQRMGVAPAPVGLPQSNPQQFGGMQQYGGTPGVYNNVGGVVNQQQPLQQAAGSAQSYAPVGQPNQNFAAAPGTMPGSYNQGGWNTQAPSAQVPVDILGLADKAASAIQTLANQNKMQQPQFPGMGHQPAFTQGAQQMPYAPSHNTPMSVPQMMPQAGQRRGTNQQQQQQRRTTASISELPVMVQYAIQNLQATGQIDGPLDEGILGMVKDLPEDMALTALQKFATIDKNTMRNKTAYLAGVLRRELEKISRR